MYLSVATMERSSSMSYENPVPEDDRKRSPQSAPSPRRSSLSGDASHSIPSALKAMSSSDPVLIKSPITGLDVLTPAVRVVKTPPDPVVTIYPLSRIELGDVWYTPQELLSVQVNPLEGGWPVALTTFHEFVDYPAEYMFTLLSVLRTSQFMDKTPVHRDLWKTACRTTNNMLNVPIPCTECKKIRYISMRTLYSHKKRTTRLIMTCADVGLNCNEEYDKVVEVLISPTSTEQSQTNEPPTTSQPQAIQTDKSMTSVLHPQQHQYQIVPYKSTPSRMNPVTDYVTWTQVAPPTSAPLTMDALTQQQYYDPYDATQAAPEHFISGYPMLKFTAPDPTPAEVNEYRELEITTVWNNMFRDFTKWSDSHKEAQYNGEEDIAVVFRWSTAMKSRFLNPRVTNPIARAELASTTLTHRARAWWLAHRTRAPKLLVTFDQLLEWIKRELVPHSSTTDAVNAWSDLSYTGDVKKYIADLERLINHFPLRRESIIIMATKPLGKEIQKRIQLMNLQHGPTGITIAQLKQAIIGFLSLHQYSRNQARDKERPYVFNPRPVRPINQPVYQIRKENLPNPIQQRREGSSSQYQFRKESNVNPREHKMNAVTTTPVPTTRSKEYKPVSNKPVIPKQSEQRNFSTANAGNLKRRIGVGPTPCFVCGSDKHSWIDCPKKKKGRCACCGSEGHLTRMCAQRYHPAIRMSFNQCIIDEEISYEYIEENEPIEESDVEIEDIIEDEIEECENELAMNETNIGNDEMEEIAEELDQVRVHFNSLSLGLDVEIPEDVLKQCRKESTHGMFPWQEPSPPDYEYYALDDDMPIQTFGVDRSPNDSDVPTPEEELPLPPREATIMSSRLPRRRFKLKFHTDKKARPHAPINPKWESQITLVEPNEKIEAAKKELKTLKRRLETLNEDQDDENSSPLSTKRPQYSNDHVQTPKGDIDEKDPQFPLHLSVLKSFVSRMQPQWEDVIKVLHNDSYPHLLPIQAPNKLGQFLYKLNIEGYEVTTLLDLGASHSFITRTWASDKGLDLTPVRPPRPVGLFSGQKNYIRHVAMVTTLQFRDHVRKWKFYVIDSAPFPAVLGADAIMSWPIFFSPLDHRIFILPELFHAKRNVGDLGGVYEYWHTRDVSQRATALANRAFYGRDGPATIFDQTPTTSEDESYRRQHAPVPICYMNLNDDRNICSPWKEYDTASLWLHVADGLTKQKESDQDNLLQLHSVTASSAEESKELEQFYQSIPENLRSIVDQFPKLFAPPDSDPPVRPVKHYIYVSPDTVPAARRAYRLGDKKREAMMEQMRELIDKGWVVPSASPWAAPILFVPKDDGTKLRMCVDFRDLNALTKKDAFPLPRLDLLLHKAAKAKVFSKLDLASGFHQIEVHPAHRELTAFILPEAVDGCSLWEWKVMPFGLINAPSTFQRAMSYALRGCEDYTAVYIDDVLIFSRTVEEHLVHLKHVFQCLQKQAYHIRLAKCKFMTNHVKFLGHILTDKGIQAKENRQRDLDMFLPPFDTPKKVRSFLGLIMWYKSFIPHVSTLAAPLFPLTSAKKKIQWTQEASQAVESLKKAVLSAPTLVRFDRTLPTRVTTDASLVGIGAVLEQLSANEWRPVAFWSRKLKDPETRYSATDIEWLAVVEAVTLIWRHFLEDIPFEIRSDHKALERKLHKSAHDPPISHRQARWIERLMPFALTFKYIPGIENHVADALSRYPHTIQLNTVTVMHTLLAGLLPRIKIAAERDGLYREAVRSCANGTNTRFRMEEGILILGESKVYIPNDESIRTLLLSEAHDTIFGGHFGIEKTLEKLKRYWYWPAMTRDVEDYIKSCTICQKTKHPTRKAAGLLKPILADNPWQIVTMDFVSGLAPGKLTGNTACLVIVDKFSKYTILESVPANIDAEETADVFLKRVVSQFGIPEKVITDRGPQFTATWWKRILEFLASKSALATSHHPQTDGQTERAIQTFLRLIRAFAFEQQNQWEELLPMFQFSLNDAYCESTGSTPFRVLFGSDPISPMRLVTQQTTGIINDEEPITPSRWEENTVEQLTRIGHLSKKDRKK